MDYDSAVLVKDEGLIELDRHEMSSYLLAAITSVFLPPDMVYIEEVLVEVLHVSRLVDETVAALVDM